MTEIFRIMSIPASMVFKDGKLVNTAAGLRSKADLFQCLSGGRSRQAIHFLKQIGYSDVTDIGGIQNYRGQMEKGAQG